MTWPVTPNPGIHNVPESTVTDSTIAGFTTTQIETWAEQLLLAFTTDIINAILNALGLGSFTGPVDSALTDLESGLATVVSDASTALSNWETLISDLDTGNFAGLVTTLESTISSGLSSLLSDLGLSNTSDLSSFLSTASSDASNAVTQITDLLDTGNWSNLTSALTGVFQSIFGGASSLGLVGSIPSTAVTSSSQSLQPLSTSPDAASIQTGGGWSYDSTVSYESDGGSALFTASGTQGVLIGTPGAVQAAQVITLSAYVQWSGLTATSGTSPIQLQLVPGTFGSAGTFTAGSPTTIAEITSPAASASWTQLTGTYTVPASGVTAVQMQLVVTSAATAGSIYWSDCTSNVSGGFLPNLDTNVSGIIASLGDTVQEFQTGITNLLGALGLDVGNILTSTDTSTIWTNIVSTFINPVGGIEQSAVSGLDSLVSGVENTWNSLFGSTSAPATGTQTISQDVVSGLTDVWDWLTGTPTPTSSTTVAASALPAISIGGVVNSIEGHIQDVVDTIFQSQNGGSATGNAVSTIYTSLTGIPATNVVGIAPTGVTFGAAGAGSSYYVSNPLFSSHTLTWSHTIAATDTCVLVAVGYLLNNDPATNAGTVSVTYGGTSMAPLGYAWKPADPVGEYEGFVEWFWLKSPPSGAQTVSAVFGNADGAWFQAVAGDSVSYAAATTGTPATATGTGTSMSMTAASASGHMVVQAFITGWDTGSTADIVSSYNQTQRYNYSGETSLNNFSLVIGDAPGASSVTFSATNSVTVTWAGIAVDLAN